MTEGTKLYVMRGSEFTKIGISNRVYLRAQTIRTAVPFDVFLVMVSTGPNAAIRALERSLKENLPGRVKGEWFKNAALPYETLRDFVIGHSRGRRVKLIEGDDVYPFLLSEREDSRAADMAKVGRPVAYGWQDLRPA